MNRIVDNFILWLDSFIPVSEDTASTMEVIEKQVFMRVYNRCYLLAFAFVGYGFTIYPTLSEHLTNLSWWSNIWPRIILNAVPFVALAEILKKSKYSFKIKNEIFYVATPIIILMAAQIFTWDVAEYYDPSIFGQVNAANSFVFTVVITGIAPPTKTLLRAIFYFSLIFWAPFLINVKVHASNALYLLLLNDTISCILLNVFLSSSFLAANSKFLLSSQKIRTESESFLGKHLTNVIWDKRGDHRTRMRRGVFIDSDIRDSTQIFQHLGDRGVDFVKDYKVLVLSILSKYHGEMLTDGGDGHLTFFAPEENHDIVDLEGIPGIEEESEYAERRIYQPYVSAASGFVFELLNSLETLRAKYSLDELNIGAGLSIETEVFEVIESEVNGAKRSKMSVGNKAPSIVNRLQQFSKKLRNSSHPNTSVVVLNSNLRIFAKEYDLISRITHGEVDNFPEITEVDYFTFACSLSKNKAS
ncbi:MAG: hypothetical protein EOP04_02165 [Proteobacteria bacterium]|nr:MAG: hypothetical protein EOP04_02165 [Pseudomonadota bacterium]